MQEKKQDDRNKTPVPELSEHLHRFGSRHEDSRGREGYKRTSRAVMGCISLLPKAIQKAWMQRDAGATLSSTCAMPLNSGNVPNVPAACPSQAHHCCPRLPTSWASLHPRLVQKQSRSQQQVKWIWTVVRILHPAHLWLVHITFHSWPSMMKSLERNEAC